MSQKNIQNSSPFEPMREPIHFYASMRNSMHGMYHGMPHANSVSPTKYFSSKISPIKSQAQIVQNPFSQTQFNAQRVLNSSYPSKYSKLTAKIQMLQKNLNRLNGQHESLLSMFERSGQLARAGEILHSLDKLKEKFQQIKRNKNIEEKRYEARHEVAYQDWIKKFQELTADSLKSQRNSINEIESENKTMSESNSKVKTYDILYSYGLQHIQDLKANTEKFLNQTHSSLKKQAALILKKHKAYQKVNEKHLEIEQRKERLKLKIGQLKCMTEYEMFISKQPQLNDEINSLKKEYQPSQNHLKSQERAQKMNNIELKFTKEQIRFVTMESLDRIQYELVSIDSKFVKVIQQYENTKNGKSLKREKHKLNPTKKIMNFNQQISNEKSFVSESTDQIDYELMKLNYELQGLTKYYKKSKEAIGQMESYCKTQFTENGLSEQKEDLFDSIHELKLKIDTLSQNLDFFKSNCSNI